MTTHSIDVVILTWNDGDLLHHAVESALFSRGISTRVWVFDNGSDPPARVMKDPRVRLIRDERNLGTTIPRNLCAAEGDAHFICFLDSDARLHPDTLGVLLDALRSNKELGLVAPVFDRQPPEASAGKNPGFTWKLLRLVGLRDTYAPSPDQRTRTSPWRVDFAISACWLMRRHAFEQVGGFDETYFSAPEDLDLCVRLGRAGWKIAQVPEARCHHPPRRRTRSLLSKSGLDHARSYVRFLLKR